MRGPKEWSSKVNEWNAKVIAEFRANSGKVGGPSAGQPLLLLHTTGAKSGVERVTPMIYLDDDARIYVFASKDGAATNPDWYFNLVKNSAVVVEVGTETFSGRARVLPEDERAQVFAVATAQFSRLAENEGMTTRVIPVVELVRE